MMQLKPVYTILSILALLFTFSAMSQESVNGKYTFKDFSYAIELSDGTGSLLLSRNSCQLSYQTNETDKSISFQRSGCTKVCCDSELDEELKNSLSQVTAYSLKRKVFYLYGADTLILYKVKSKEVQNDFAF